MNFLQRQSKYILIQQLKPNINNNNQISNTIEDNKQLSTLAQQLLKSMVDQLDRRENSNQI